MALSIYPSYRNWVFVCWDEPGAERVTAIKELKALERVLKIRGLRGWLAASDRQFTKMHDILQRLGATRYAADEESYYFLKEVN